MNQIITPTHKVVAGEIFDASGHTDFTGSIEEAMGIIMDGVKHAGKWAYINGNPFIFESYDAAEQDQVRTLLSSADQPHFLLTGKVQGGGLVAGSRAAKRAAAKAWLTRRGNTAVKVQAPVTHTTKALCRGKITSQPLSKALGSGCAHLAVAVHQKGGKDVVDVFITSYNGARAKLQKHQKTILSAIFNGLRPDSELKRDAKAQAKQS